MGRDVSSTAGDVTSNIGVTVFLTSLVAAVVFMVHDCNVAKRECASQGRVWHDDSCQEGVKP